MINKISIKNFKSILADEISLRPLTVIVGPNGSGKSNLIKALEFLAAIPEGLVPAVNSFGGRHGLLPKKLSPSRMRNSTVSVSYRVQLPPVPNYPPSWPGPAVDHTLEFRFKSGEVPTVTNEQLCFHEALALGAHIRANYPPLSNAEKIASSRVCINRSEGGIVKSEFEPKPSEGTLGSYLAWLGFSFLEESVKTTEDFYKLLTTPPMFAPRPRRGFTKQAARSAARHSLIESTMQSAFSWCSQYRNFVETLSRTRRYELLLHQLRTEQPSAKPTVSREGGNLPSALRNFREMSEEGAWERMMRGFSGIASHVASLHSRSLRTGKEFIEFLERGMKRGVESWETSDGTLRALAIILLMEIHPRRTTILIEEPEHSLHPWAVRSLVEHVRTVSEERDIQVVMTTHSPQVLERVLPDEVLVAARDALKGTKFFTLNQLFPGQDLVMGEIGDLWVKGLLGGVPGYD